MPEFYIANFANFTKPVGGTELCFLLGSKLDDDAAGAAIVLTNEQREALTMPDTIIVDESDVKRLAFELAGRQSRRSTARRSRWSAR